MLSFAFVLSIWIHLDLVEKSNAITPEILPAIMDEFKIQQPIIHSHGKMSESAQMIEVVKIFNYQGYSIGFSQKQLDKYQSSIIFTDELKQFKWTDPTFVPILTVSMIQTEEDLMEVDVSIGSEVLFLDWVSLKVYESYTINNIQITRYLGQFQQNHGSGAAGKFVPAIDYISNMENRRCNFYGLQITGAISWMSEDPRSYPNLVQFFPNNDTYDITNFVTNPYYYRKFWNLFEMKILEILESQLNFTSKIFLRKDMELGSPYISSNGSIVIDKGLLQDLGEGSIEVIWDYMYMNPIRSQFGDYLPLSIRVARDAIYVPIEDTYEKTDWKVFLKPLGTGVWIAIIIKCTIFSTFTIIIEWFHDCKLAYHSVVYKILASFTPNFGVAPFESKSDHITSHKAIVFAFVLDGLVFWISYQSFLYPELSTIITKDPFNDLDSLANLDYILYTGPKGWDFYITLSSTQAYEKIMKNNVDLELSSNSWDISIGKALSKPKSAIFADSAFFDWGQTFGSNLSCLLKPVWTTNVPNLHSSIMMRKGSQFTRIFSQEMRNLQKTGNLDLLRKRYTGSQECKPLLKEKPLGFEKLSFLFTLLIFGCIMSILVVFFEYMTQTKKKKQELVNKDMEISLMEKIANYVERLSNQETKNILGRLILKHFKKDPEDSKLNFIKSDDFIYDFVSDL